jgi:hypothetical protein
MFDPITCFSGLSDAHFSDTLPPKHYASHWKGATDKTLVFLDEIGRATEASAGAAIAAAVLEELADRRTPGIFSTHLHPLLDLDWGRRVDRFAMGTTDPTTDVSADVGADGYTGGGIGSQGVVSTHKLVPGVDSRVTLAFEVAAMKGIAPEIVNRARELHPLLSQSSDVSGSGRRNATSSNAVIGGGGSSVVGIASGGGDANRIALPSRNNSEGHPHPSSTACLDLHQHSHHPHSIQRNDRGALVATLKQVLAATTPTSPKTMAEPASSSAALAATAVSLRGSVVAELGMVLVFWQDFCESRILLETATIADFKGCWLHWLLLA